MNGIPIDWSAAFIFITWQRTWCVAKPSSDDATLLENINYACSQVDCSILRRGCPCSFPDNLMNHASVAMNLYYQSRGKNPWNCHFKNSALVVVTDPSMYFAQYSVGGIVLLEFLMEILCWESWAAISVDVYEITCLICGFLKIKKKKEEKFLLIPSSWALGYTQEDLENLLGTHGILRILAK